MNMQDPSNVAEHQDMQALLPWYAAGSLADNEAERVQRHLRDCPECRAELAWQRRLIETAAPLPAALDQERALARLMSRLDEAPVSAAKPSRLAAALLDWLRGPGDWKGWAIAAQALVIVVLAANLLPADAPPEYKALGSAPTPLAVTPDVLVVFKPDASVQDVQRLLKASGARLVGGPTATGAWLLDVEAAQRPVVLAALRADAAVELAEALAAEDRQ
ncbi:Putative zinc-finger [Duganella sp. CF458]|uniref:zf-HC2 domain-containing protein n=1 Tax=Duganella sp. CF458 TaxID=1884368 RepID=UPI0008E33848|nr:zf-HC2 domain-containing protein [Duganella sp. CF458]SFF77952.1 Putative zinc-finger [Duganella sp. CF458]